MTLCIVSSGIVNKMNVVYKMLIIVKDLIIKLFILFGNVCKIWNLIMTDQE